MKPESVIAKSGLIAVCVLMGCASTQVEQVAGYSGEALPRPDRILVYDLAVSPDEVKLDRGLSADVVRLAQQAPRTEQEIAVGRQVANALSKYLVKEIRDLGLPAQRATGAPPTYGNTLLIEGHFSSIDEGNRTARVVIGLGAGRTDVETDIQVYQMTPAGPQKVEEFRTVAKSGRKPGMAETMGVGGATGNLAVSAVVGTGAAVASETLGVNVEADAQRTAKEVGKKLARFFAQQGWISSN